MWRKSKSKRKFSGKWVKIYWVIPILLIIILLYLFFKSGIFTIKQVEIQTGQLGCVDENQLKNYSGLLGQNFFLIDSAKVEDRLKRKFFCIKSAPVSKYFPDKVRIQTSGRQPVALLITLKDKEASLSSLLENISTPSAEGVQDTYLIDNDRVVFAKGMNNLNIPEIYSYDFNFSLGEKLADAVSNAVEILEKVKTFGIEAKKSWISNGIFIVNPDTLGPKVIFRLSNGIDIQLASLQLILNKAKIDLKELEFIDLRFDKPIVRFAPKENHGQR